MAKGLCQRILSQVIGCPPSELPSHGLIVKSAGIAAMPGDPTSPQAQTVAEEYGVDLRLHRSQCLTAELLADATHVFAMSQMHLQALAIRYPNIGPTAQRLCHDVDLPDPIGGDIAEYRSCAQSIEAALRSILQETVRP